MGYKNNKKFKTPMVIEKTKAIQGKKRRAKINQTCPT